jgi:hypothetical protein
MGMKELNVAKQIFAKGRVCMRYLTKGSNFILVVFILVKKNT